MWIVFISTNCDFVAHKNEKKESQKVFQLSLNKSPYYLKEFFNGNFFKWCDYSGPPKVSHLKQALGFEVNEIL